MISKTLTRVRTVATVRPPLVASIRAFTGPLCSVVGTTWNSTILTPSAGTTSEVGNGAHARSVQNAPIQRCGRPLAASVIFAPAAPVTTSRYLNVLAIEPGRSAPVHGASESAA